MATVFTVWGTWGFQNLLALDLASESVAPIPVVFDVDSPFRSWPSPPPTSGNPYADAWASSLTPPSLALAVAAHPGQQRPSPHRGSQVDRGKVELYLRVIAEVADYSAGGIVDPPATVHDCRDHEDNYILDLATEVGALLIALLVFADRASRPRCG